MISLSPSLALSLSLSLTQTPRGPMTAKHTALIRESLTTTEPKDFHGNKWGAIHVRAWDRNAMGIPFMLTGLAQYADAYRREFPDCALGDDGVLGDHWKDALVAVRGLLNGPLGGLDGGTVDTLICKMLANEGLSDE